ASFLLACSDLQRARQTAAPIASRTGYEPQIFPELRDINNGKAANLTRDQARAISIPPSDPLIDWTPYPEAESWRQFHARVTAFLETFGARLEQSPESAAVLISHASTINIVVLWWLGLAADINAFFRTGPASLSVLSVSEWGERVVERLNDTAHLYGEGQHDPIRLGR
ncbi:MAG TPA: histidine phosphatase family protein, partial [Anaerolineales bacterium]|nr:histidine phosphatase family protein [Anaerolineales bacterium]